MAKKKGLSGGEIAAIALAAGGLLALGYAALSGSPAGAPPSGPPGGGGPTTTAWKKATVLLPNGIRTRVSLPPAALVRLAAQFNTTPDATGLQTILNGSHVQVWSIWGPLDTLPADWPSDDPSPGAEFHAEVSNQTPLPIPGPNDPSILLWAKS